MKHGRLRRGFWAKTRRNPKRIRNIRAAARRRAAMKERARERYRGKMIRLHGNVENDQD